MQAVVQAVAVAVPSVVAAVAASEVLLPVFVGGVLVLAGFWAAGQMAKVMQTPANA